MKKGKIKREFSKRPLEEREWLLQNTWCNFCGKADIGMTRPTEYESDGKVYISGICLRCGNEIVSELSELPNAPHNK